MVHASQNWHGPQGSPSPHGPTPPSSGRAKRPLWHWLLLAAVTAGGLLVVAIVGVLIVVQLLGRGDPQDTLDDFYTSLGEHDCELFMDSTTEDFRDWTGWTTCEVFDEQLGNVSAVDYRIDERINRRGYAIFEVTETYSKNGETIEVPMRFYVRRIDGQWDLDAFEQVDPSADPII